MASPLRGWKEWLESDEEPLSPVCLTCKKRHERERLGNTSTYLVKESCKLPPDQRDRKGMALPIELPKRKGDSDE